MKLLSFAAATALVLPGLGHSSPDALSPAQEDSELVILPAEDGLTVGELLEAARQVLDIDYFLGADENLQALAIPVQGSLRIPRDRFLAFFEKSLRMVHLLHFESGEGADCVHYLLGNSGNSRQGANRLKSEAKVLELDELAALSDRGMLVTTSYTTEHLPARDAVNTLAPYFGDNLTDNVRNIDGTRVIVMTGSAEQLAGLVNLLRTVDVPPQNLPDSSIETVLNRLNVLEAELATVKAALAARRR